MRQALSYWLRLLLAVIAAALHLCVLRVLDQICLCVFVCVCISMCVFACTEVREESHEFMLTLVSKGRLNL